MVLKRFLSFLMVFLFLGITGSFAQKTGEPVSDSLKNQIFGRLKNFSFSFYVDAYVHKTLDKASDTSNIVPFSSNCPVRNQIRMNVAAFELYYSSESVRGKFAIQYGDAPNLLASPNAQWIKTIRQANFGFNIVKDLWVDFGYLFNPVGYESSWAVLNQISFVTVGGYFGPGSVLGVKLSYKFSEKFRGGLMMGNPFSIAYSQKSHMAGIIFLTYQPMPNFSVTYNNFFGNQALRDAEIKNNILYNELIVTYDPGKHVGLVGQLDYAAQTNSGMAPDTNRTASMLSGFFQACYRINDHFALTGRYEFFNDPDGFLSGVNKNTNRGIRTDGFAFSFEYKPVKSGYLRLAYRFLDSYPGSKVFYSNTSDQIQSIIFTTGMKF
ncbi:MAG: outer membrane beta-barrel protein [Bacteroidota bacterium]